MNGALGTYNYHARHYDAGVGRFLGVDPARQFASSYAYVGNNPINGVDPTGALTFPLTSRPLPSYNEPRGPLDGHEVGYLLQEIA